MASRKKKKKEDKEKEERNPPVGGEEKLHPDTKKSIFAVICLGVSLILLLASFDKAGPFGTYFYQIFRTLFGWGYFLLPAAALMMAFNFLVSAKKRIIGITLLGACLFAVSGLGVIDLVSPGSGGLAGDLVGTLEKPFGFTASLVITFVLLAVSFLVTLNMPIRLRFNKKESPEKTTISEEEVKKMVTNPPQPEEVKNSEMPAAATLASAKKEKEFSKDEEADEMNPQMKPSKSYTPPPVQLLKAGSEKPTIGDLRSNANIIKRTLEGFGIPVEMGEINIGPAVTRYTLKPAEGIKLSRITSLNQDLSLALAAHPIRIEAPIPGKSFVGIEVPNKAAALVRLGNLMSYPDFKKSGPLSCLIGRDVSGEPILANIEKMPHLLVAGSTGSGKSIFLHALIISLIYKNSPETLRLILIDPKRVELSVYNGIPHLATPVITETKKSAAVFRWLIKEMERRYEVLLSAGARDIKSFNAQNPSEIMPFLLLIIDELADLMTTYGREVEGSVVRLAQMARATGIHLLVSTQRPSVEVITGLIKANITSRVALQVPSQIDSRTILDSAGAEKLLGHGDLLFVSNEFSKPKRIQGVYVSEEEIKKVASFIKSRNKSDYSEPELEANNGPTSQTEDLFPEYGENEEDELYGQAVETVLAAKKASASLLQRRLKVGYARAARLLDIMEEKGIIGPGEGAKPREIHFDPTKNERGE